MIAAGTKNDLLAGAGIHAVTRHPIALGAALTSVNMTHQMGDATRAGTASPSSFVSTPTPKPSVRSRPQPTSPSPSCAADGAGLDEMFLALTADTQHDQHTAADNAGLQGAVA